MAKSKKQIPAVEQEKLPPNSLVVDYDPVDDVVHRRRGTDDQGNVVFDSLEENQDRPIESAPKPREFTPRDCTLCITSRPPRQQFSRVYAKRGKIRYCKCGYCGNTWSQEGD
jgi:TFIIF-interacting CTD phosphatase-like protein